VPIPVPPWVADTFPGAKSLNLSLYTSDGTLDNPTGVAFLAQRPLFFESYTATTTFHSASGGSQTSMSSSAATASSCNVVLDTAGYFGQTSDLPGQGYYQYTPVISGTAGDGVTAGGYMVVSSFVPLVHTSTQTSVSADLYQTGVGATSGSRQQPNTTNDSCPFYLDLVNVGGQTWAPAVTLYDSGAATAQNAVSADASGETPRFSAMWAAVSATTAGQISYTANGVYSWTAPTGVTSVTVSGTGAAAGGGAGNVSAGGTEYGGGGGGGGENAQGSVAVTPGNVYTPTVGAGGAGGTEPGGGGTAGGSTVFAGDVANVTANGGSSGAGATVSGNGAGGAGGTGSGASTHHNGGAGAAGSTITYGGGGGSSAGTSAVGNSATTSAGAAAPVGGGPGGNGGNAKITLVQRGSSAGTGGSLKLTFGSALQAGNTIIVCAATVGTTASLPSATLSGGTVLTSDVSTSENPGSGDEIINAAVLHAGPVTGGQTSVTITGASGSFTSVTGQYYEVAGLGAAVVDASDSSSSNAASFSTSTAMGSSPDIWFGQVAAYNNGGSISISITGGNGWNTGVGQASTGQDPPWVRAQSGYQIPSGTGTATYAGTMNHSCPVVACLIGYTTGASTGGNAPLSGPGGGGGGGLGLFNGGNGFDGELTLTWTGVSGGGYGTPPLPTPYASWGPSTRVGTSGDAGVDVDLNGASGITDVVNFLSNPPVFRIAGTNAQSITTATLTNILWTGASPTVDSYSGWGTNLLVNPGFETGSLSPWTAVNNATAAIETSHVHSGTYAASVTPDGATSFPGVQSGFAAVNAGEQYTATAWALASAALAHQVNVGINWFNSSFSYLSTSGGSTQTLSTSVWTSLTVTGTAPAGAAWATCAPTSQAQPGTAAEVFYADDATLTASTAYVVQRAGLYLFHGLVAFANASGGTRQAGVTVNGTTYWGPGNLPTTAGTCNVTKTQVFSLQAGDTVQLACRQDKGSPVALSTTDSTRMFLTWLNEAGTPATLWTPPDATYRWVSGTPVGALPTLFQQHLANDLGFLCQGPYLMAYQTVAQSGLTASSFATITMDTVGGIVHSDTGDNYSGWTSGASNAYTAQQPGWYLYCAEYFLGSSAASGATAVAGVLPSTSGGVPPLHTPDSYQRLTATTTASVGAGCTALGLYYLLAGETLTPQAEGLSYSGTFGTLTGTSNGGTYASHCELIWVSN
jgi:Carbohydrate binding domain